jgi:hypothetical protein
MFLRDQRSLYIVFICLYRTIIPTKKFRSMTPLVVSCCSGPLAVDRWPTLSMRAAPTAGPASAMRRLTGTKCAVLKVVKL